MNIDKEAEILGGFTSTHIMWIAGGVVVDVIIAFIFYGIFKNFLTAFIFFMFLAANVIVAVKLSQNLPDGYFLNFFESLRSPKIYMPGENNEPDQDKDKY